jgi:endonuclease III
MPPRLCRLRWSIRCRLMPLSRADGSVPSRAEKGKARAVLNRLRRRYVSIGTALDYESPFQLLVVTVLSAQTTDENVNKVAPVLFEAYPGVSDLADADPEEVEKIVYSTGFFRQKTKSIIKLAQGIEEMFDGEVPMDLDELVKLPGVGRKTASVLLAEAWDVPAIAVDTHVRRVTRRLGLTDQIDPIKIERDLMALYPKGAWSGLSMRIIQFGRDVCDAKRPLCGQCELFDLCEFPDRFAFAHKTPPR